MFLLVSNARILEYPGLQKKRGVGGGKGGACPRNHALYIPCRFRLWCLVHYSWEEFPLHPL